MEKLQLGKQHVHHKQTQYNTGTMNGTIHRRKTVTQSSTTSQTIQNTEHTIFLFLERLVSAVAESTDNDAFMSVR
jgi:hypothetical protein